MDELLEECKSLSVQIGVEVDAILKKFTTLSDNITVRKQRLKKLKAVPTSSRVVELNVGGERLEISRNTINSILAKPELSESLVHRLASLLSGRWDRFLPRDHKGYIYLDWEFSWIMPCITEMTTIANRVPGRYLVSDVKYRSLPDNLQDRLGFEIISQLLQVRPTLAVNLPCYCVDLDQPSEISCLNSG